MQRYRLVPDSTMGPYHLGSADGDWCRWEDVSLALAAHAAKMAQVPTFDPPPSSPAEGLRALAWWFTALYPDGPCTVAEDLAAWASALAARDQHIAELEANVAKAAVETAALEDIIAILERRIDKVLTPRIAELEAHVCTDNTATLRAADQRIAELERANADLRECVEQVALAAGDCPTHGKPDLPHALAVVERQRERIAELGAALTQSRESELLALRNSEAQRGQLLDAWLAAWGAEWRFQHEYSAPLWFCSRHEQRIAELERENTFLRPLANKEKCLHCGEQDMARCPFGFPGCAKADDIVCADAEFLRETRERFDAIAIAAWGAEWRLQQQSVVLRVAQDGNWGSLRLLNEQSALLERAEATIERYRTVMEGVCATGLAMGREDVDAVVRESWVTLAAIREQREEK